MLNTIGSKISCLFLIAVLSIVTLFTSMHFVLKTKVISDEQTRISLIGQSIARMIDSKNVDEFLKEASFLPVINEQEISDVKNQARLLLAQTSVVGKINSYFYKGEFYIELITPRGFKLYSNDANADKFSAALISACAASLIVLGVLYVLIYNSLRPIKLLNKQMKEWSQGEIKTTVNVKSKDEIGCLVSEFSKAASRIDAVINSRQFFLRAIMHELKTPIGKARIIAALPRTEGNSARLDAVFARLDLLISEFGQMERVLSRYYELQLGEYHSSLVYEQAIDLLMMDDLSRFSVDFGNDEIIKVDLQLFSLMIKNLLDNAIKYASSKMIYIKFSHNKLEITNEGAPLKGGFSEQVKAFKRGESNLGGLGLGLYLIERIVELHGFKLEHNYVDKTHTFSIIWSKD